MKVLIFWVSMVAAQYATAQQLTPQVARGMALQAEFLLDEVANVHQVMLKEKSMQPLKVFSEKVRVEHEAWINLELSEVEKKSLGKYSECGYALGVVRTISKKLLAHDRVSKAETDFAQKKQDQCKMQLGRK